ncbi:hypothetical protein ABGB12_05560 [Actinocorallia sp. B10E7]
MVLALSACGVGDASERSPGAPGRLDVSVFRNAVGNGLFARFKAPQQERALLAAGQSRILLLGTVRGFRLTGRPRSVVMSVRVEETLKGAGMVPGRMLRIDLGRRDNAPGSARRANRGTVARYRAAVPEGSRFLVRLFPREGFHVGAGGGFVPYGPTSLVFEGEDGIVGAYADLPETWTEQRSLTGLRDEIFYRLRSDGTVCAPRLRYPQEAGEPLRLGFEDCLPREERNLDRKIRRACQGITMLRPEVHLSRPETDLGCLKVNIEG